MSVNKKQMGVIATTILGSLGVQNYSAEGGWIAPPWMTELANTVPIPVLVALVIAAYFFLPEGLTERLKRNREVVCSKCAARLGIEVDAQQ